jgi:glycerol-3-phosphate acyltransferase PlsX
MVCIAVDLMGGDAPVEDRYEAVLKFAKKNPTIDVLAFVAMPFAQKLKQQAHRLPDNWVTEVCASQIMMSESPLAALRNKQDSSLSLSVKALKEHRAQAILSAGNTGALVAFSKYWLKLISPIERPALATVLPGQPKPTLLLDVGASLEYRAQDFLNLAELGVQMAPHLMTGLENPEVALLNVGTEHIKGHDTIQQADHLLQQSVLNYAGFCEGSDLFNGRYDVICCDGFVGNITLKACEGLIKNLQYNNPGINWRRWIPGLKSVNLNPAQYNGALLLGLDGLVVKSHGHSDSVAFYHAIKRTADYIKTFKAPK